MCPQAVPHKEQEAFRREERARPEFCGRFNLSLPLPPRRRRGVVIGRDLVRGAEMDFGETAQTRRPFFLDNLPRRFLDRGRNADRWLTGQVADRRASDRGGHLIGDI